MIEHHFGAWSETDNECAWTYNTFVLATTYKQIINTDNLYLIKTVFISFNLKNIVVLYFIVLHSFKSTTEIEKNNIPTTSTFKN